MTEDQPLAWLTEKRALASLVAMGVWLLVGGLALVTWLRQPGNEPEPEATFMGDSSAAYATVLLDGVEIGRLVPRRFSDGESVPWLESRLKYRKYRLTFISTSGETLSTDYVHNESGTADVDFERDSIRVWL